MSDVLSVEQATTDLCRVNERIARALGYSTWANGTAWEKLGWVDLEGDGRVIRTRTWSHRHVPNFANDWKRNGELKLWLNSFGFRYLIHQFSKQAVENGNPVFHIAIHTPHSCFIGEASTEPDALCRAVIALLDARPELAEGKGGAE